MTRYHAAAVLTLKHALHPRFKEIAAVGNNRYSTTEEYPCECVAAKQHDESRLGSGGQGNATQRSSPSLIRRERLPKPSATDEIAHDQGASIGHPHPDEERNNNHGAVRRIAQKQKCQYWNAEIGSTRALPENLFVARPRQSRGQHPTSHNCDPRNHGVRPHHGTHG